jgi:hypothetical protein
VSHKDAAVAAITIKRAAELSYVDNYSGRTPAIQRVSVIVVTAAVVLAVGATQTGRRP